MKYFLGLCLLLTACCGNSKPELYEQVYAFKNKVRMGDTYPVVRGFYQDCKFIATAPDTNGNGFLGVAECVRDHVTTYTTNVRVLAYDLCQECVSE